MVLLIMLVGLCYVEISTMFPVSGGEVVYTYEIFGTKTSFAMGAGCLPWLTSQLRRSKPSQSVGSQARSSRVFREKLCTPVAAAKFKPERFY